MAYGDQVEIKKVPKVMSAESILRGMSRAPISNAKKIFDTNEYVKVDYQQFFSIIPKMGYSEEILKKLDSLQEEITYFTLKKDFNPREDKLYVYFILRLQEILYDRNRAKKIDN